MDKQTILAKALALFKKNGIQHYSDGELMVHMGLSVDEFQKMYPSRDILVDEVLDYDIEDSEARTASLIKNAANPVEELLCMMKDSIEQMETTSPNYSDDIMNYYPKTWKRVVEYLGTNTYRQIYDLMNRGIQQGSFRKDINIDIVSKFIIQAVFILVNPEVFPTSRYDRAEVYRGIYLYYVRGLCTEPYLRATDGFFARR